jgi:hypothetical protein
VDFELRKRDADGVTRKAGFVVKRGDEADVEKGSVVSASVNPHFVLPDFFDHRGEGIEPACDDFPRESLLVRSVVFEPPHYKVFIHALISYLR